MRYKILFLVPYPLKQAPSQRFRFEQYFENLAHHGFEFTVQSFLDSHNNKLFYQPGNSAKKLWIIFTGFVGRILILFRVPAFDYIFIHREVTPLGPPVFEWVIARVLRARIIYDFDDAIWLTDRKAETGMLSLLKWRNKVASICRWSYKVSCGNSYLGNYARQYNRSVIFNPSTIDTRHAHNPGMHPAEKTNTIRIGWTGSHSTLKYLKEIEPVIGKLTTEYPNLEFMVIADRAPDLKIDKLKFVPWRAATEIADLMQFDIGIMPLPNDEWTKGKCGFKLLQYMALEIPAVASSVGANLEIITQDETGYLCATPEEWYIALKKLIDNSDLRLQLGKRGRKLVEARYSVVSNTSNFLALFE
ncbi:glycosyltransferase family 4 protein [Fulvivirgaceae bacterium PWU4]|uniref:Glycosyltransferase family 4 protein n=2 Tax=Chryseosolibacter histidini TaxID=2782349 RepID=A0AAP2GM29_9BACT|nr:glycosyltransferase family 4 protein [Chryseosolibacter histidini]